MTSGAEQMEEVAGEIEAADSAFKSRIELILNASEALKQAGSSAKSAQVINLIDQAWLQVNEAQFNLGMLYVTLDRCRQLVKASQDKDQGQVEKLMEEVASDAQSLDATVERISDLIEQARVFNQQAAGASSGQVFVEVDAFLSALVVWLPEGSRRAKSIYGKASAAARS